MVRNVIRYRRGAEIIERSDLDPNRTLLDHLRLDGEGAGHESGHGAERGDEMRLALRVQRAALLRTARLLMRGEVMVPASVWGGA